MGDIFHLGRSPRTKHLWYKKCLWTVVFPLELSSEDMSDKVFVNYI